MSEHKLYNGKIILNFDSYRHTYSVNGKKVPGVTSLIGILEKPALKFWAVNMAIEVMEKRLVPGQAMDELEIQYMLEDAKRAHTKRLKKAADVGTLVHQFLEKYIKAGIAKKEFPKLPHNNQMRKCISGFFKWCEENKVKFKESEQKIYSKKYNYAGCFDAIAIVNNKKAIIDFKTSNALYPEYFLQGVGYLLAKEEEEKKKISGGVIMLRLSKTKQDSRGKDIEPFEAKQIPRSELINGLSSAFLACIPLYNWKNNIK